MPRARWTLALAVLLAASAAALLSSPASAGAGRTADSDALEAPLLGAITEFRRSHGLRPLKASPALAKAARAHAVAMGNGGFFAHESADGTPFWKRVQRFYPLGKSSRWTVGENLLWRSGEPTPAEALQLWIDSPGHRKVLLTAAYREVGISSVRVTAAPGAFGGLDITVVAADFGVRQ